MLFLFSFLLLLLLLTYNSRRILSILCLLIFFDQINFLFAVYCFFFLFFVIFPLYTYPEVDNHLSWSQPYIRDKGKQSQHQAQQQQPQTSIINCHHKMCVHFVENISHLIQFNTKRFSILPSCLPSCHSSPSILLLHLSDDCLILLLIVCFLMVVVYQVYIL